MKPEVAPAMFVIPKVAAVGKAIQEGGIWS